MGYSNGLQKSKTLHAAVISAAAEIGRMAPPLPGKAGRLRGVAAVVTTGVTVAAGTVKFGHATDDDAYGTLTIAISAAGAISTSFVRGVEHEVKPDEALIVTAGGEPTAGAADIEFDVEWY